MPDRKALISLFLSMLLVAFAAPAFVAAQEEASEEAVAEVVSESESEAEPINYTDVSWDLGYTINTLIMLLCAVLVLFMQAGFAMVEVGLNSQKNTINILFKNVMDFCLGVVLYFFVGYGLMYGGDTEANPWFGWGGSMVTRDAQGFNEETGTFEVDPTDSDGAPYASNAADFMFQVAFAATAATIVSGAVAGRMKFIGYLVYSMIITAFIYPISGYWKWGGGMLDQWGFQDFAGSIVVHAVGGFAGLAGAIALGPRIGRYTADGKSVPIPGHNITFAALGVFILWVGWYGFNPGSQLTYNGIVNAEATTYIALTTTLSAAAGAIVAMILSWGKFGKPDITMALNGALAGLVGITANCDRVSEISALIIGAIAGVIVFFGILLLDKLKIDDPVGAVPVHGFCGIWGGLATGIFGDIPDGLATRGEFFMVQLKSSVIICAWAFVTMLIVFYALKAAGLLRVSPEEEQRGLDITEHGMEAYTMT
ncbi:MAG: ammonium transporter [Planctomycetaceae bacterium]|nr:ammonium transporter [Planctomycetaceae bacterium]